jgi:hypothetical protein
MSLDDEQALLALQRQSVELLRTIKTQLTWLLGMLLVIMIALGLIVHHWHWYALWVARRPTPRQQDS